MDSAGWHSRLAAAGSESDVVFTVREFVAGWPAADLSALPENCRPGGLIGTDDVFRWAYSLASSACVKFGTAREEKLLLKMSSVFGHASRQLAMFASHRTAERPAAPAAG